MSLRNAKLSLFIVGELKSNGGNMNLYIQEWQDGTATLVNEYGQVLSFFDNISEAETICRAWQLETKNKTRPPAPNDLDLATIYIR